MSRSKDPLADIWSRFERGTSARLSGASVEGTVRPSREDSPRYAAPQDALARAVRLPAEAGTPDPASAALSAMQASFTARPKRGRKAAPPAPEAPESLIVSQVLRDVKATEARVMRRETDYLTFAAGRQAEHQRRRKRRFLGLF